MPELVLVGRSSSHFTRTARIFAHDLGVPHAFRPVYDILAIDTAAYGDNPALKMPVLVDDEGPLFGTDNICRALARRSGKAGVVLRGDVTARLVANAEEMTLHVMNSEVSLIAAALAGGAEPPKVRQSLVNALDWLDARVDALLEALPPRPLSFVETALYCTMTHLPFRKIADVAPYARLAAFCERFGAREAARATPYAYDKA